MSRTEQAAQRCADLANAIRDEFHPSYFLAGETFADREAFRRYVERKDAEARRMLEWLLGLVVADLESDNKRIRVLELLRADLLSDPQPTLLEEFERDRHITVKGDTRDVMEAFADWIAKRQENEA